MRLTIPLLAAGALALFGAVGCSSVQAKADTQKKSGTMMPTGNPEERLEEQRLADATKGLRFDGGLVSVVGNGPADIRRGETLRLRAERVTTERNTWFVSVGAFRDAILADPANAKSYEGLARALLLEGKTDYAEAGLATAIKLDAKLSPARYELGMVKQMDSNYTGAVVEWRALTKIDPNYRDVFARMAIASYYAQDFGSAWKYLGEADKRHQEVPPQFRDLLKEADPRP